MSEHWSKVLLEEWSSQALLERELGLPPSVVANTDELGQAKGQIGFITMFTKPLFEAATLLVPGSYSLDLTRLGIVMLTRFMLRQR